jgi:hypothetical protein
LSGSTSIDTTNRYLDLTGIDGLPDDGAHTARAGWAS